MTGRGSTEGGRQEIEAPAVPVRTRIRFTTDAFYLAPGYRGGMFTLRKPGLPTFSAVAGATGG